MLLPERGKKTPKSYIIRYFTVLSLKNNNNKNFFYLKTFYFYVLRVLIFFSEPLKFMFDEEGSDSCRRNITLCMACKRDAILVKSQIFQLVLAIKVIVMHSLISNGLREDK